MSKPNSNIWSLIKSILLPVDIDATKTAFREIREDVRTTSWLQLMYRLEGFFMLMFISGAVALSGIFVYQSELGLSEIQTVGVQYAVGIALLCVFIIAKIFVWIVKSVNNGNPIWGQIGEQISLRVILSLIMISVPIYFIFKYNPPIGTIILFTVVACVLAGSVLAGICGLFSSAIVINENYIDRLK